MPDRASTSKAGQVRQTEFKAARSKAELGSETGATSCCRHCMLLLPWAWLSGMAIGHGYRARLVLLHPGRGPLCGQGYPLRGIGLEHLPWKQEEALAQHSPGRGNSTASSEPIMRPCPDSSPQDLCQRDPPSSCFPMDQAINRCGLAAYATSDDAGCDQGDGTQ